MTSIYIIGEAYGEEEARRNQPFVGPSGYVLTTLLKQVGITDYTLDNVFNLRPPNGKVEAFYTKDKYEADTSFGMPIRGRFLHKMHSRHIISLFQRLATAKPNVIVALGNTPLWALTRMSGIAKWRGSPLPSYDGRYKIIASWHPSAVLRQWELRPVLYMDLCKALRESASPRLIRPRRHITYGPTLHEIQRFVKEHIEPAEIVACDVETKAGTVTEVGFAPSRDRAIVIPFWQRGSRDGNYWSPQEERAAWELVRHVLQTKRIVGQNFQYDAQYFLRTLGMTVPHWTDDTMLLHHTLQPELKKGLGFLGSIYTNEPSWKFMRTDHATMKREDD